LPPASRGFPPIAGPGARLLILGSLPGAMSLERGQYYAQPRNAFWRLMGDLFAAGPDLDYAARGPRLVEHGVAVWDVCAAAVRPGSLDAAILPASVVPNDFAAFLGAHSGIRHIFFNGAKAAALYERQVLPGLPAVAREIPRLALPSTSPAHAGRSYAQKLDLWRRALAPLDQHYVQSKEM
jgi:hypoxanthine-DNA glycosylase